MEKRDLATWSTYISLFCEEGDTRATFTGSPLNDLNNAKKPVSTTKCVQEYLCIDYQNVARLRTKAATLFTNVLAEDYDIIAFTETWLCEGINDSELFDNRYTVIRRDRDGGPQEIKGGGGVLLAFKKEIHYKKIEIT